MHNLVTCHWDVLKTRDGCKSKELEECDNDDIDNDDDGSDGDVDDGHGDDEVDDQITFVAAMESLPPAGMSSYLGRSSYR